MHPDTVTPSCELNRTPVTPSSGESDESVRSRTYAWAIPPLPPRNSMMGRRLLGTGHAWEGLAAMLVLLVSLLLLLLLLKLVLLLLLLLLLVVVVVRLLPWSTLIVRGSMRMTVAEAAPSAANEQGLKVDPPLLPDAEMVPETAYVPAGKTTTRDPECERGER
jgi:hypothetical protein